MNSDLNVRYGMRIRPPFEGGMPTALHRGLQLVASLFWALPSLAPLPQAEAQQTLAVERMQPGDRYEISTKGTLNGSLDLPAQGSQPARKLAIVGNARVIFRERILRRQEGSSARAYRIYEEVDYQRKLGDQEQEAKLRPAIRRFVIDIRENDLLAFSIDGPMTWAEIELVRTHPLLPILEGFLPPQPVAIGATWPVPEAAVIELLAVKPIRSGSLTCQYAENIEFAGKKLAQFAFRGTVVGKTSEGEARSEVAGAVYVDLATRRVHSLRAIGDRTLLGSNNEAVGKVAVDYQITVRGAGSDPAFSDEAVAGLPNEPAESDLAVLYEHPGFGLRLRHPRHWILATVERGQLIFETRGSTLALHPEPKGQTPTTAEYARQVSEYLAKAAKSENARQRIAVIEAGQPREDTAKGERAGNFRYRVTIGGEERTLDYWVREKEGRGITASARLLPTHIEPLALEVAKIVGSVEFFEPTMPAAASDGK